MATDRDIEQFISDSFASIWDLELLSVILEQRGTGQTSAMLLERMRASDLIIEQGVRSLVASGLAVLDESGKLFFRPVNAELEECAVSAVAFYNRFPGRARRLMIARKAPGLTAFADAFRLRKD
ncbi:MAG TPA: hypothetical protein VFT56_17185 [Sphingomonas sp.]|nr:hypothetical protein [Sphingomonas sp.]